MSLDRVRISNFKSLKSIDLDTSSRHDLFCFFGKNGSGKSNIIDALNYFYECLDDSSKIIKVIDNQNPYVNKMEIELIYNLDRLFNISSNEYIDNYKNCLIKYTNEKNQVSIKLSQTKKGQIKWHPDNKELLRVIKKVFPIYLFDTRFIDVVDWNIIWNIIADLSITNLKVDNKDFRNYYDDFVYKTFGDKALKSLKIVESELANENINISEFDYVNRFKSLMISRLGGTEIHHAGNRLEFFSDGMNSLKYISLALGIIPKLASTGWKSPIILIDEIEIGLHPQFIRVLTEKLKLFQSIYSDLLITTHSPVLTANLLKSNIKTAMIRVSSKGYYTDVEFINQLTKKEYMSLLTMTEASYYFAESIVLVEGISELQLFNNSNIKKLFSFVNNVEIVAYDSNNSRLKLLNPDFMNFNIPTLLIVDKDKIVNLSMKNGKTFYKKKNDYDANPLANKRIEKKEILQFYEKGKLENRKSLTRTYHQFFNNHLGEIDINPDLERLYIPGTINDEIHNLIKNYCIMHNVFPVKTTVEGVIVNENSYLYVIEWLINKCNVSELLLRNLLSKDQGWTSDLDYKYRTIIIRLILNGKMDTAQTIKSFDKMFNTNIKNEIQEAKQEVSKKVGNKADGWIISFIDYFFITYIDILNSRNEKVGKFMSTFPELYQILNKIENMLELDDE